MTGSLAVALPILLRDVLHGDARLFGLITAAVGVGEVAASIFLGQVKVRPRRGDVSLRLCRRSLDRGDRTAQSFRSSSSSLRGSGFTSLASAFLWRTALPKHVPRELLGRVTGIDFFGGGLPLPL